MQMCSLEDFSDYPAEKQGAKLTILNFSLFYSVFQSSDAGLWCFMGVFYKGKPRGWEYLKKINNNKRYFNDRN